MHAGVKLFYFQANSDRGFTSKAVLMIDIKKEKGTKRKLRFMDNGKKLMETGMSYIIDGETFDSFHKEYMDQ